MIDKSRIFVGGILSKHIDSLYEIFSYLKSTGKYTKVINPFCGRFVIAKIAVKAGFSPDVIYSSDLSLYSTMLWEAGQGTSYPDFKKKYKFEARGAGGTRDALKLFEKASNTYGALCAAMKWSQYDNDVIFEEQYSLDILENPKPHIEKFNKALAKNIVMKGTHYENEDALEVFNRYKDDPEAIIFLNPPSVSKGYSKIFAFEESMSWNHPHVPMFDIEKIDDLWKSAQGAKAFVMMNGSRRNLPYNDSAVMLHKRKKDLISIIANRPQEIPTAKKVLLRDNGSDIRPLPKYKVFNEKSVITPESKIQLIKANRENVLYYRSLWKHRLGEVVASTYYFWTLDGQICAALGMEPREIYTFKRPYIGEVFQFSAQVAKYPRLNRLLMMCLVSEPTKKALFKNTQNGLLYLDFIKGIETTCLTKYRENRANRGLFNLIASEKKDNDTYHLKYQTEFHQRTYEDALKIWLNESYGKRDE